MKRRRSPILAFAPLVLFLSCRGACQKQDGGAQVAPAVRLLRSLPARTRFVVTADVAAISSSNIWAALVALVRESPADRALIDQFATETGLDPFRQIHRIVAAFPEDARTTGEYGLLIDGDGFDEKRLVAYAVAQAKLQGREVVSSLVAGRTLRSGTGPDKTGAFFLGSNRFVLGAGGWAEQMAQLSSPGPGDVAALHAGGSSELASLCGRVDTRLPFWFAAVVPAETRRMLQADPRFGAAASVARLAGAVDVGRALRADLLAELSNEADAQELLTKLLAFKAGAKTSPQVLLLGLSSYVDSFTVVRKGASVTLTVTLTETAVNELLSRVSALAKLRHR